MRTQRWRVGAMAFGAAVVLVAQAVPVSASHQWDPPRSLTTSGKAAVWYGSLAVTGTTTAVAAYRETVNGTSRVFVRSTVNNGGDWTARARLSSAGAALASHVTIAADGQTVDALWIEGGAGCAAFTASCSLKLAESAAGGEAFGAAETLASSGYPGLGHIARSGVRILAAWTDWKTGVVHVLLRDNGVGDPFTLATTTNKPFGSYCKVHGGTVCRDGLVAVGLGDGVAYVAWLANGHVLKLRRFVDGGPAEAAITLATNAGGPYGVSLSAGGDDVIVSYTAVDRNHYWPIERHSTNKGVDWTGPHALSPKTSTPAFDPLVERGSDGTLRVLYTKCPTHQCARSRLMLTSSMFNATVWEQSESVTALVALDYPMGLVELGPSPVLLVLGMRVSGNSVNVFTRGGM